MTEQDELDEFWAAIEGCVTADEISDALDEYFDDE